MPIPMELITDNIHDVDESIGAATAHQTTPGHEFSQEEDAKEKVLNTDMMDLKYIHKELQELYRYLSVGETLQELSGKFQFVFVPCYGFTFLQTFALQPVPCCSI